MKHFLFAILLLLSINLSQAQLLWKISGNGLTKTSYVFGTHHLIPVSFLDSIPNLYKAFNASEIVVGEIVINSIEASSKIKNASILPDKKSIIDYLDSTKYKVIDNELKATLKISLQELSRLHPALILTLYQIELFKRVTQVNDDAQSDSYFQIVANEKGKKVLGLETIDKQIELLFDNTDIKNQAENLYKTIVNKELVSKEMMLLNKLYKKESLNELYLFAQSKENTLYFSEKDMDKLLYNRNEEWLKQLPEILKSNSCFIAVGALHLAGEKGLIEGLRNMGYKLKPL